jgi:uncharacterized protein (TIGR02271 family)
MALYKFKEFYPDYRKTFGESEIVNLDSYSVYSGNDRIGSVDDVLVDDSGRFRYLVVDTGFWIFGKKILLPIGLAHFNYDDNRINVDGLTREQVQNLPDFKEAQLHEYDDYEERTRQTYTPLASRRTNQQFIERPLESEQALDSELERPVEATGVNQVQTPGTRTTGVNQAKRYDYDRNPNFYGMSDVDNHNPLRLYEERLITHKRRDRVGEVKLGKHVETETAEVSVPVEKERVVIERRTPTNTTPINASEANFREGEVARMEVYEETADIDKQAFVREEVNVRKEVDRDTVSSKETVRREELDVDTEGRPNIQGNPNRNIKR